MLFKIVLEKQIRVFDCKETPTIKLIHAFIAKTFSQIKAYAIYYLDEDNDHIVLETDSDLNILLSNGNNKPKIFINPTHSQAFEDTVKIQIQHKQEQKEEHKEEQKEQIKAVQEAPKIQNIQFKEPEVHKIQKNHQQVHPQNCDVCESQIVGIRYNCSVCKSFDLCQKCEQVQRHQHPLIKIRFREQAPLSCKIEFNQARASLIAQKLKLSQMKEKQKIVYQNRIQREQIVISYLGNLLGQDEFEKYKQFSKVCKCQHYDDIVEEYLSWTQNNETSFHKITNWILKHLNKIKEHIL